MTDRNAPMYLSLSPETIIECETMGRMELVRRVMADTEYLAFYAARKYTKGTTFLGTVWIKGHKVAQYRDGKRVRKGAK